MGGDGGGLARGKRKAWPGVSGATQEAMSSYQCLLGNVLGKSLVVKLFYHRVFAVILEHPPVVADVMTSLVCVGLVMRPGGLSLFPGNSPGWPADWWLGAGPGSGTPVPPLGVCQL